MFVRITSCQKPNNFNSMALNCRISQQSYHVWLMQLWIFFSQIMMSCPLSTTCHLRDLYAECDLNPACYVLWESPWQILVDSGSGSLRGARELSSPSIPAHPSRRLQVLGSHQNTANTTFTAAQHPTCIWCTDKLVSYFLQEYN